MWHRCSQGQRLSKVKGQGTSTTNDGVCNEKEVTSMMTFMLTWIDL